MRSWPKYHYSGLRRDCPETSPSPWTGETQQIDWNSSPQLYSYASTGLFNNSVRVTKYFCYWMEQNITRISLVFLTFELWRRALRQNMRNVNMTFTKPTESDVLQCPIEQQLTQREKSEYTCTYDRVQSTYRHLHPAPKNYNVHSSIPWCNV